jgi:hypothetical protein
METDNFDFTKVDPEDLPCLLAEMNANLAKQTEYLERHAASMQALKETIQQLDAAIKSLMKTEEISIHIKQTLISFVEQRINPLYYQMEMYSALPSPSQVKHHRLTSGKRPRSTN